MKRRLARCATGAAAILSAGGMLGLQLAAAPSAFASSTTTTPVWSGQSTTSQNWSDPGNWSSGTPATSSTTLSFPDLPACDTATPPAGASCYSSINDMTGLTVGTVDLTMSPPAAAASYNISGNPVTLTGGINVTGDPTVDSEPQFDLPLNLSAGSQTWSLPGPSLTLGATITGQSTAVTAALSANSGGSSANLDLSGNQIETGSFTASGGDSTQTGAMAGNNGYVNLTPAQDINGVMQNAEINATNGNPVNVTDTAVSGAGALGNLTVTGGSLNADLYGSPTTISTGKATFDSSSNLNLDFTKNATTAGTDYSQLTSAPITGNAADTGAVDLGGALLTLNNVSSTCAAATDDPAPGTVYTLVNATSLTGDVSWNGNNYNSSNVAQPVPTGGQIDVPSCANDGSTYPVRIDYTPTTMTATVLQPTTTTVSAASASPAIDQSDVLTATVSSASGTPNGTVSFDENYGGNPIPGCTNVALSGSAPYQATCTTSFNSSGQNGVGATFNPAAISQMGSSNGGTTVDVQPIAGAQSSSGSTATAPATSASATNYDNGVSADASGGQGTVTVSSYNTNPVAAPTFNSSGEYFDVQLASGSTFTSVSVTVPNFPSNGSLYWYNPSSGWQPVKGGAGSTVSPFTVVIDSTSSPNLSQMTGTVFGVATPAPSNAGYHLAAADGGVFNFASPFYGSEGGVHLNAPIVGGATAPDGKSYYLAAADGGVFNFGAGAPFHGSAGAMHLNKPVVGMAVDPVTGGYWLVASDGGVFAYGAPFFGSMAGHPLNQPIVGIAAAPDGQGYYLVAKDGGVFAIGTGAHYQGSMGGAHLNQPVVGMAVDTDTGGYWLVAADGGIFNFGAPFHGSLGNVHLNAPVVGMAFDPATGGYWLGAADGGVFNFGNALFEGSMGGTHLNAPVVSISAG